MADERVSIDLDVDYKPGGARRALADLVKLTAATRAANKASGEHTSSMSRMESHVSNLDNRFMRLNKTMDKHTKILKRGLMPVLTQMGTVFKFLKLAIMPTVVSIAAFTAAAAGAKLILATVNVLTKAWGLALKGLAAGAAAALGGISMLASAMSELKAAAVAPFTGYSKSGVQSIWQSLMGDPRVAALGVDNIQQGAAALMKMKVPLYQINRYMKELGDYGFYAGAGDAGAGLTAIIAAMKTMGTGTLSADSLKTFAAAFGDMAPNIEEVGKAFVGKDTQRFIDFLLSNPAQLAKFNNGLGELNNTMMGTIKTFRPMIQGALEPFGTVLNDVAKGPLGAFRDHLVDLIKNVMPSVVVFLGTKFPGIIDRLSRFLDKLADRMKKILNGMSGDGRGGGTGISNFFQSIKDGWAKAKGPLEEMAKAWDIIWSALKPILAGFGGMVGRLFLGGSSNMQKNADSWASVGESIGKVFRAGGPVETFVKTVIELMQVLGKTLGPVLMAGASALKSPMWLFSRIIDHEDDLKRMSDSLVHMFGEFGPFWDAIGSIVEAVLDALPDVAAVLDSMLTTASGLVHAFQPVLDAVLSIAKQFKIIQGIILWMIGKAVVGKLAAMLGSVGAGVGGNALMNRTLLAGLGIAGVGYGMQRGGGVGLASAAAGGALAGYMIPGLSMTTGLGLGLLAYGVGGKNQGNMGVAAGMLGGGLAGAKFGPIGAGIGIFAGGVLGGAGTAGGENAANTPKQDVDAINAIIQGNLDQSSNTGFYKTSLGTISALQAARHGRLGDNADTWAALNEKEQELSAKIDAMNPGSFANNLWKLEGAFGNYTQVAALADEAGVNLMDGAVSLQDGIDMLNTQAGKMKSASDLFQEALNVNIYDPRAAAQYQQMVAQAPQQILEAIAAQGYDESMIQGITDQVIGKWQADLASGKVDIGGATEGIVGDLQGIADALYASGQGQATLDMIALIDAVKNSGDDAQTAADKQKTAFDTMVQGLASSFDTSFSNVLAGLSGTAANLYNQISGLNGMKINIASDGTVTVTGGSAPKSTAKVSTSGAGQGRGAGDRGPAAGGDTFSPRFNMLNARRAHAMVSGGIGGRRSITSMWRDYNLGSGNSDHITGRAMDIVGDNLVSYANRMREMGGFAEFHGSGKGRHLHVVPPQLPMGDRPIPRPPTNAAHQPQVQQNMYTTVNPAPKMDEEMLARKVARHQADAMRNMMERS